MKAQSFVLCFAWSMSSSYNLYVLVYEVTEDAMPVRTVIFHVALLRSLSSCRFSFSTHRCLSFSDAYFSTSIL